jgi:hypothetical protein
MPPRPIQPPSEDERRNFNEATEEVEKGFGVDNDKPLQSSREAFGSGDLKIAVGSLIKLLEMVAARQRPNQRRKLLQWIQRLRQLIMS